jgi:hypothetical protein
MGLDQFLARRPAVFTVAALWLLAVALLAVNLTIRASPREVRFVHSPPAVSAPAAPLTAIPAPPLSTFTVAPQAEPAPRAQSSSPPRRSLEAPRLAAPAPTTKRTTTKQSKPQRPVVADGPEEPEEPDPVDPCAQGCDDPVPSELSPGPNDEEPIEEPPVMQPSDPVTQQPEPEIAE